MFPYWFPGVRHNSIANMNKKQHDLDGGFNRFRRSIQKSSIDNPKLPGLLFRLYRSSEHPKQCYRRHTRRSIYELISYGLLTIVTRSRAANKNQKLHVRTEHKLYPLDKFLGDDAKLRLNIHPLQLISYSTFFVRLIEFFAISTPAVSFEDIRKVDKQVGAFVLRSPRIFTVFQEFCKQWKCRKH